MKKLPDISSNQKEQPLSEKRRPIPRTYLITAYLLLGIIFIVFGTIIFSTQSSWCGSCHVIKQEVDAWKKSSHSKLDCLSCHRDTGMLSIFSLQARAFKHLVEYMFRTYPDPVVTDVPTDLCLYCHPTITDKVAESYTVRIKHGEFTPEPYGCTECHSDVGHSIKSRRQNRPNMDRCFTCHNGENTTAECDTCHTQPIPAKVTANPKSPYLIIHGKNNQKTHGMGDRNTCDICHQPGFCRTCHKIDLPHASKFKETHGDEAKTSAEACWACHREEYCNGCHGLEMPHPLEFLPAHPQISKKEGMSLCTRCHIDYTCDYCHRRSVHRPPIKSHQPRLFGKEKR